MWLQEEKKGFREKLAAIQEVCLTVQEGMDMAASLGERVKKWVAVLKNIFFIIKHKISNYL